MKCLACNCEMLKLEKGKPVTNCSNEPGSNVESIVYDIDYSKAKDVLHQIMETKSNKLFITPDMYVCPKCGEIKQALSYDNLQAVIALEA